MKIAVDVMGFENDVFVAIQACEEFLSLHRNERIDIILVGNENIINEFLHKSCFKNSFQILHTPEFVSQTDTVLSARRKLNSSIQLAANYLSCGKVDGLLSACNTAVFVYTMYATIGMLDGIKKIGFMPTIPTKTKTLVNLIDVGATLDVDANDLLNYALMANEYAKQRTKQPRVAVLNIGTEEHKGTALQHETDELIKKTNLNYLGFIEANKILSGDADIIITDGYTGNIALKACEGSIKTFASVLKYEYKKPKNFLAALFSYFIFKKIAKKFDYKNHAGAFVMGLKKVCVKTHGAADKKQFFSALEMLYECLKNNVIKNIEKVIRNYGNSTK